MDDDAVELVCVWGPLDGNIYTLPESSAVDGDILEFELTMSSRYCEYLIDGDSLQFVGYRKTRKKRK